MTPSFDPSTNNYTARVGRTISSITVTPTARESNFKITVNGIAVSSGSASPGLPLVAGINTILVKVTNGNGFTNTYSIVVTREATPPGGSSFAFASLEYQPDNIQSEDVAVRPAISPNGDGVNDVLTIDNIQKYPENKVTLIDMSGVAIFQVSGYDNVNKVFNGRSNITGAMEVPGTYFYLLEYKAQGQSVRKTGFFVLKY